MLLLRSNSVPPWGPHRLRWCLTDRRTGAHADGGPRKTKTAQTGKHDGVRHFSVTGCLRACRFSCRRPPPQPVTDAELQDQMRQRGNNFSCRLIYAIMKPRVLDCLPGKFARVAIDPFGKPVQMLLRKFIKTASLWQETAYEPVGVFVTASFK